MDISSQGSSLFKEMLFSASDKSEITRDVVQERSMVLVIVQLNKKLDAWVASGTGS